MTDRQSVSDAIATVDRRTYEIQYRVRHGILDPHETADRLQQIIENGEPKKPRILEFVTTTTARGAKKLIAKDKFREGEETDGVSIAWLGSNFKSNFLGKVEENVEDAELKIHRLREPSRDMPIIHELGGEEIVETSLSHLWSLLKRQGHGEDGDLLTNGYANIFHIRDSQGVLCSVYARWNSDDRGWNVEASSVEHPLGWLVGFQVFSRDS